MAFLRIMTGDMKGQKFEIDRDEVVIGRATENVVTIEDPAVSSHHCTLHRAGKRFTLKDMNSTNGTRLNNVLVKEHRLSPKDVITVGAVDIMFDGDDVEPFDRPQAATGPQVTVRLGPGGASPIGSGSGFGTKKDRRFVWYIVIGVAGLAALAALVLFLFSMFRITPR